MDQPASFEELLTGLRARDTAAVEALCREYGPFIRAAVRRQLHPRLRTRFDSLDFVQDVWASFLAIPHERYTFASPQALIAYLTRMAQHRVVEVFRRRFGSQKESIFREASADQPNSRYQLRSSTPTPSQCAIAGEEWERLASRFPAGYRTILDRLREGYSSEDIARLANVSLSTVNRIVRRLKDLIEV